MIDLSAISDAISSADRFSSDEERPLRITLKEDHLSIYQDRWMPNEMPNQLQVTSDGSWSIHWELIGGVLIESILKDHGCKPGRSAGDDDA